MKTGRSVLLVGGFDAGKSNFLFRLWLAINESTGLLSADGLPQDVEYLQKGASHLLAGKFAPHTSREIRSRSIIPFKCTRGTEEFRGTLVAPDCSGEEWLAIYRNREWSVEWEELVSEVCGCLVFVRVDSDHIVAPLDWITWCSMSGSSVDPPSVMACEDAAGDTPTQIVLIDWLQCLRRVFTDRVSGSFRPRIAIVVSAWDLVPADQQAAGPDEYLATNFPMFKHFLDANTHEFEVATFGVSIVGGDLANEPGFRDAYLDGDPRRAGFVVHSLGGVVERCPDLTLPVVWAMGLWNASGEE